MLFLLDVLQIKNKQLYIAADFCLLLSGLSLKFLPNFMQYVNIKNQIRLFFSFLDFQSAANRSIRSKRIQTTDGSRALSG